MRLHKIIDDEEFLYNENYDTNERDLPKTVEDDISGAIAFEPSFLANMHF